MLAEVEVGEAEPLEAENEEDDADDDEDENPDVLYEANVMRDQRILDDDDVRVLSSKSIRKSSQLKVLNPFVCTEKDDDEWQIQRAHRLKRKLKRTMIRELRKKDVMPNERAKMVSKVKLWRRKEMAMTFTSLSVPVCLCTWIVYFILLLPYSLQVTNVWNLKLSDRWSLYRRWVMDMRERYRRAISYLHHEFDWGVERLKKAKAMQDLEILEHADVIGMTTTGELLPVSTVILEASRLF